MTSTGPKTVIESRSVRFFHLFCEGRFKVPWHQRRYDWKPDHVQELLRDLDEAFSADRQCYFLGMVIFVESALRQWHINDGQQRMVTLSLICACLRRLFTDHNDSLSEHRALRILFDVDESSTNVLENIDHQPSRIIPPSDDTIVYYQMIRGRSIGANGKLTLAWRQIEAFVLGMGIDKAQRFFNFLCQKLELACLYIPDSVDPNSVYETINCRGKRLDDLDLIRNHLYSYFNADDDEERRRAVNRNLDEKIYEHLRDNARFTDYARCYFQSQHGFLRKSTFYRETRDHIRSGAERHERTGKTRSDYVFSLIDDLSRREQIELFRTIAAPNRKDPFVEEFTRLSGQAAAKRNTFTFLKELQTYKVAQPLLFSLLMRYVNETEAARRRNLAKWIHVRIKHITSFVMRTAFVAKFEPSHFESEFSNLAQRVMSSKDLRDVDVDGCLRGCDDHGIISDRKFKTKMCQIEMRDAKKIKRFLFGVNCYVQTDSDLVSESRCTIEHVLPKAQRHWANWHGFENDNPEDWIHRIGNLTLLGRQDNKPGDADNQDFVTKRDTFLKSAVQITREIGTWDNWTPREIEKRQRQLAGHAARVWSFERNMT